MALAEQPKKVKSVEREEIPGLTVEDLGIIHKLSDGSAAHTLVAVS
jgi:hypothetical protein